MKLKMITLAALGILIYSCASKTPAPIVEAKKETNTKELVLDTKNAFMSKELLEGKNLFENNCAKCHKLYNPKDYSAQDWKSILAEMQKKARLDDAQIGMISNYISSQL